jgi:hypothetical protein
MTGLGFLLMIAGPPIVGLIFGLVQLAYYQTLVKMGTKAADDVPFFPILWLRGMLLVVVIGVIFAVMQHLT